LLQRSGRDEFDHGRSERRGFGMMSMELCAVCCVLCAVRCALWLRISFDGLVKMFGVGGLCR
jgi:hypothetical protein